MVGTAVSAGASIIGGALQGSASSDAASAQTAAADRASEVQLQMFNQLQQNAQPYMASGGAANNAMLDLMGLRGYVSMPQPVYNGAGGGAMGGLNLSGGSSGTTGSGGGSTGGFTAFTPTTDQRHQILGQLGFTGAYGSGEWKTWAQQKFGTSDITALEKKLFDQQQTAAATAATSQGPALTPQQQVLSSPLMKAISMDQATLEKTPGYQFNLRQGLKSVQNSAAARGLGVSGAAQKGAAAYATGLADSTYQNQFNNAVTNQTNQYNRLMALTQLGQNSALNVGAQGVQTGANIGSNIIGAGNAQAAGRLGQAAAFSNGLGGLGQQAQLQGLFGNQSNNNLLESVQNSVWNPANSSFF